MLRSEYNFGYSTAVDVWLFDRARARSKNNMRYGSMEVDVVRYHTGGWS